MDKNIRNRNMGSSRDQDSLGILNMENLKVFGDISECSFANVNEKLRAERHKALAMLDKPRLPTSSISTNVSDLISDKTIDINTTGSTLNLGKTSLNRPKKPLRNKAISVSDILKTSFAAKARQLEKKLPTNSVSILKDSISRCSSLNGGEGFSFGSTTEQNCDETFAPAELMQSKLIAGEISWAQQYTAMPTAVLSRPALEKIRAPLGTSDIENSRANSTLAKDQDFSMGAYFQTRSDNICNIVGSARRSGCQPLVETPETKNKTYTKTVERKTENVYNPWNSKRQRSSEILSLSAIDKALRNLDLDSDTSSIEVYHQLKGDRWHNHENDENKENDQTIENALNLPPELTTTIDSESFTTPIKSAGLKLRRLNLSLKPCSREVHTLTATTTTDEEDKDNGDEKTPVNKPFALTCSTRHEECNAVASISRLSPTTSNKESGKSLDIRGTSSPKTRQYSPSGSDRCDGLISRCSSSSSEFSHRDGQRLPLKVTHTSLCWGSTKLRTDVRKSLQIKNIAQKRLVIRLGMQGPGYQLVGNECSTITLQAMECRMITLNFCPTVCGAAVGALLLIGTHAELAIPLFGYGGNASISIQGLLKGPVGSSFLTIGDVSEFSSGAFPLRATCRFLNKGPLTAFVSISVESTLLMKLRLSDAFVVRPSEMILPPHTEGIVEIEYHPNREDIKNILKKSSGQQVLTLANMRIFCGDEPNRQRMRNLIQKMDRRQRDSLTSTMLDSLWSHFPKEQNIENLSQLNEPTEFILDLVTVVRIIDVALTLNRDFDESAESSLLFPPDADETVLFRTICPAFNSLTSTQNPVDQEADTTNNWSLDP
ncbi:uncharacterized protein Dwil_GK22083 [Drosophila willistoni]|uniref:Uncharacterized protein n=1 Tax=Drosophila willistoni TaxID=7260 RepID=B4MYF5_DROWI|nr:uncharacterized protein LOC6643355 [Drosophila willistoni]EDW77144.2 uncharacterized protein Dwil_GK22083 [Drosophila willistoni]